MSSHTSPTTDAHRRRTFAAFLTRRLIRKDDVVPVLAFWGIRFRLAENPASAFHESDS
ncbi:hypothetical protein [Streptomyces sp. NPDC056194]|uniref:hypothetical protein n=1 Tax=unclassified Streptomyces TaxID=2593676 RepID=UPI0035DF7669